jgi:putative flippase GtrA
VNTVIESHAASAVPPEQLSPPTSPVHGPFAALRRALHQTESVRYVLVGGFNTLFAIGLARLFVLPVQLLFPKLALALALPIANYSSLPFSITVSFLGFKWFVFRTRGNYLKEWLKCFAVYGVTFPIPGIVLPIFTAIFLRYSLTAKHAALFALIVNSGAIATFAYFAHKKFSFKR